MSYCPTCGVSPPEVHWQGCQTAAKVTDAADFDEGYRQGRRDTRAELVPVIDRQRAEILTLREALAWLKDIGVIDGCEGKLFDLGCGCCGESHDIPAQFIGLFPEAVLGVS